MLGTIIGGIVVGGILTEYIQSKKEEKRSKSQVKNYTKTVVVKESVDTMLQRKVCFYDQYRELDNKLARYVREGYKGVAYLKNGLRVSKSNSNLQNRLRNIKDYRNKLSHDKRRWVNIESPSNALMSDLAAVISWVKQNENYAAKMVYKGKKAYENK